MATNPSSQTLPPEALAFATKIYDAARSGQLDIFEQALPKGLPANMTNEKGDTLVRSIPPFLSLTLVYQYPSPHDNHP